MDLHGVSMGINGCFLHFRETEREAGGRGGTLVNIKPCMVPVMNIVGSSS